jgi:hypothetical protein
MRIKLGQFKAKYLEAKKNNKVQFKCNGKTFITQFAKYVILHAEDNLHIPQDGQLEFSGDRK